MTQLWSGDVDLEKHLNILQHNGYCVIDNFIKDEFFRKIKLETAKAESVALTEIQSTNAPTAVLKTNPTDHPSITEAMHMFTHDLMDTLNMELKKPQLNNITSNYSQSTHLNIFKGYMGTQLRMRVSDTLGHHIDRSSAQMTVLYYLNECKGGELRLWVVPEDVKYNSFLSWQKELFPKICTVPVDIPVKENRLVLFWSKSIPHEVLEVFSPRSNLQVFYAGKIETTKNSSTSNRKYTIAYAIIPFIIILCLLVYNYAQ